MRASRSILRFAAYLVGLSLLKGLFQFWMRVILIGNSRDIEYDLRNDLFAHLVSLSPDFYGRQRTGDIMARATNDLNAVRMMLGPGVMYWTETSLTFVLAIAVMLSNDWRLTLLAILPAPLVSLAVILFGRAIHDAVRSDSGHVFRHQQPGAGESVGRAHDPGLRAGRGGAAAVRRIEPGVHRAEHSAGAHFGAVSNRCWRRWWASRF